MSQYEPGELTRVRGEAEDEEDNSRVYWDITSLYPGEYIDLLASFHWQFLYIRLETTATVAYNIATTIPIDYKQGTLYNT